jgi:hypothetical protein
MRLASIAVLAVLVTPVWADAPVVADVTVTRSDDPI